uniref:Silk gland protein 3 n=1 Tax=Simulium vittatum TaxID=7192 RepID=W0HIG6_SIMVI|nr:silk gland protein 3 [Simulium vittatum]
MQPKIIVCFLVVLTINLALASFAAPKGCKSIEITKENAAKPEKNSFEACARGFFARKKGGAVGGWAGDWGRRRRGSGSASQESRGWGGRGWGKSRGYNRKGRGGYGKGRGGYGKRRGYYGKGRGRYGKGRGYGNKYGKGKKYGRFY